MGKVPHCPPPGEAAIKHRAARRARALRRNLLLLTVPYVLAALVITPLAVFEKETPVEIELETRRMAFSLGDAAELFGAVDVEALTLSGFAEVELGAGELELATELDFETGEPSAWRSFEGRRRVLSSRDEMASATFEKVTLNALEGNAGTLVTLIWDREQPAALVARLRGEGLRGRLAAGETLRVECGGCAVSELPGVPGFGNRVLRLSFSRRPELRFTGRTKLTLGLELGARARLTERDLALGNEISFVETRGDQVLSTIERAEIRFTEMADKKLTLEPGDFLVLGEEGGYRLRSVELSEGGLRIRLAGRGALATGLSGAVRSRLPSVLEWLSARQAWALWLNALVLVATTGLAITQRLRLVKTKED